MAVLSAIAIGVAVGGTVLSLNAAKKSRNQAAAANEAQKKINRLRNAQNKRAFLRNFRQSQANVLSSAIASGIGLESSRTRGTIASEKSQRDLAVSEFAEADRLGGEVADFRTAAAGSQARAQRFSALASFATNFISFGGGSSTTTPRGGGVIG